MTLNAPLFEGVVDNRAMVRGGWGAAPVAGLEPQAGDLVVEKMRMSAWEGTRLETILKSGGATRSSAPAPGPTCRSSTPRAPAPTRAISCRARGLLFDDERRVAQRLDQLRAAERLGRHQRGRRDRGARLTSAHAAKASVIY